MVIYDGYTPMEDCSHLPDSRLHQEFKIHILYKYMYIYESD